MSGDNMGAEQTSGRAPSAQDRRISTLSVIPPAPTQSETAVLPRLTPEEIIAAHKHRGSFADIRSMISPAERSQRKEEKKVKAENQFGADVERIAILLNIDSSMDATRFNEFGLPPQVFPVPKELLVRYATANEKKDERKKGELREGVRLFTEQAIKRTLARLTDNIRTLYLDRGATQAEVGDEIDALTQHVVNGKKKVFGLLGKDQQMGILGTLSEKRADMLRENMPHYMYHLTAYQEAAVLTDQQIDQMREDFKNADEGTQAIMAADARIKALLAMDRTITANLDRLREIEAQEHGIVPVADKFLGGYEKATLTGKGNILERIKKRKLDLSMPHLHEVYRLRRILEHANGLPEELVDPEEQLIKSVRLEAEAAKIDALVRQSLASIGKASYDGPSGEIYVVDAEDLISSYALLYEDPSIIDTFHRVALLRTSSSDILDS